MTDPIMQMKDKRVLVYVVSGGPHRGVLKMTNDDGWVKVGDVLVRGEYIVSIEEVVDGLVM